jgi:ABC-2 type transport system permease protein
MNTMHSAATGHFPPARVTPNAAHAFGGIWRLTVQRLFTLSHWLIVAVLLVLLVLFSLPVTPTRAAAIDGLLPWASRFYVCFLVPILAFISAAGVMRDDLKADTVDYIFTRPVSRPWFICFRYVSHVACAQLDFLLALAVVIGIGVYWQVPNLWSAVPLLLLAQMLAIIAFSAFGFFCGLLTSRYVIIGLLYGAIVEVGIGNVPTQLNQLSMIRHMLALMRPIVGESEMGMTAAVSDTSLGMPATIAALLGFAAVMLAATVAVFTFKELAAAGARDN